MENKIDYKINNHQVIIYFYGELDVNHCRHYRLKIDSLLNQNDGDVLFDFTHTTFVDSAGIGLVLGRYQSLSMEKRKLTLCHLNPTAYKVFELSGMFDLMDYLQEVGV